MLILDIRTRWSYYYYYDQIQQLTKAVEQEKQLCRDLRTRQKEIDGQQHALKRDALAGVQINGRRRVHSKEISTQPPSPTFHHTSPAPEIPAADDELLQNKLFLPSEPSAHPDTLSCPDSPSTSGLENMTEAESSTNAECIPPSDAAATLNNGVPDLDYSCLDVDWENFDWDNFDFSTVDFQATENPWPFPVNS